MDIRKIIKGKGTTMEDTVKEVVEEKIESVKEVIEEKVEAIVESKQAEIKETAEEVAKKVDEVADELAAAVEASSEVFLAKVEDVIPGGAKIVEVVDAALVGVGFSCGCLGWKFSVEKIARLPAK